MNNIPKAKFKKHDLWTWSDPHFEHKHAIRHNARPWETTAEMNEGMIANYNSVVKPQDTCIWVGDCFFCGSGRAKQIMDRLNGKKILVTGNHDFSAQTMLNCGFDFVCEKMILKIAEQEVWVCHYPYAEPKWFTWAKWLARKKKTKYLDRRIKNEGKWLIHGHTHSKFKLRGREIHVGVDAWGFKPVHLDVIEKIITTGRLPDGKAADNRFVYDVFGLGFIRSWLEAAHKFWRNKTR